MNTLKVTREVTSSKVIQLPVFLRHFSLEPSYHHAFWDPGHSKKSWMALWLAIPIELLRSSQLQLVSHMHELFGSRYSNPCHVAIWSKDEPFPISPASIASTRAKYVVVVLSNWNVDVLCSNIYSEQQHYIYSIKRFNVGQSQKAQSPWRSRSRTLTTFFFF